VADDLTPADTVLLQHQGVIAFITESGGPLSHTAIMARSLGIPAVVGVRHARRMLRNDEQIIVDGEQGAVLADATEQILGYYRQRQERVASYFRNLDRLKDKPAVTEDGYRIQLMANIELPEDLEAVTSASAAGIGLYRTEFLYMNRNSLPDEDEQFEAYLNVVNAMQGKPVTIRTLDLGADKQFDGGNVNLPTNPALGLRAIRLCLREPELFRAQLRAILRVSAYGPVRMMIPMLSNIQELFQTLNLLKLIKDELRAEGISFNEEMPVGGMIEVPAAAISAYMFAQHLDFLSIGTNDLIQYTLAIDRIDEEVNYLYDPLHPSVLRLIHQVLKAANRAGIPVSMCGEMAGDIRYTRLLLGLGLREFSMQTASLLEVKSIVNQSRVNELVRPSRSILKCAHPDEARSFLETLNRSVTN
jgi:phosphotransferase system enzyme I (PtsI)